MHARAPSKAILSGEHAVVYGKPALALAVSQYASVEIERAPDIGDGVELQLISLNSSARISFDQLCALQQQLQLRHQRFLADELPIEQVLDQPGLIFHYALSLMPDCWSALAGCRLRLRSQIPVGAGMGSSAATVTALLKAISDFAAKPLRTDLLIELVTGCEQLQHGRSSGLDPAVCGHGGLLRFEQGVVTPLQARLGQGWYLLDSGKPDCSTGQCGSQVRAQFGQSGIWEEFAAVTDALQHALQQADTRGIHASIRQNQQLLERIGVVPDPLKQQIRQLEQQGASAKISGAGAISGNQAGLVLVYAPQLTVEQLSGWSLPWQALTMDQNGACYECN